MLYAVYVFLTEGMPVPSNRASQNSIHDALRTYRKLLVYGTFIITALPFVPVGLGFGVYLVGAMVHASTCATPGSTFPALLQAEAFVLWA